MLNNGFATYVWHIFSLSIILKMTMNLLELLMIYLTKTLWGIYQKKMFISFELNDEDHALNLCDIGPDLNFYNSLNQFTSKCNYLLESSFHLEINHARGTEYSFLCATLISVVWRGTVHHRIIICHYLISVLLKLGYRIMIVNYMIFRVTIL